MVRITTWNVNGIRNPFSYEPWRATRTFSAMFDILEADVVIMQELKIQRKDLRDDMVLIPGWDCYFSLPKHKKGYSGVGIYTRQSVCAPIRAEEGLLGVLCPPGSSTPYRELPEDACIGGYPSALQVTELDGADPTALDAEGRCLVLEFPAFVLFGVYSPANSNGLRDGFRSGFLKALDTRIRNLKKMGKHVILTGDLNVSREPIDTARAEENMREEGITLDEYQNTTNRRVFNQLVNNGRVPGERDEGREEPVLWDICREFHPERTGMFTHWEQKINARPGNFGSRIDYVLCSIAMKDWFADSNIQEGLMGSDHCPVFAVTKDMVEWKGKQVHISDIMNPPGTFEDGKRLREFDPTKDLLPISAKRLPEFDISKRRSIKDMFSRKSSVPKALSTPVGLPGFSNASPKPENPDVTQVVVKVGDPGPGSAPTKSSTATGPTKTPEKRPASSGPIKSAKRTKTNTGATNSQFSGKGQQSLRGFFTSKTPTTKSMSSQEAESSQEPTNTQETETSLDLPFSTLSPLAESSEPFIDPEASKESWTKLFSKKPPPRCEGHQEPCISLTTKKPGQNCGRSFWICPRPIGPSGQKETGTQWRCGAFIWASDWKGPG